MARLRSLLSKWLAFSSGQSSASINVIALIRSPVFLVGVVLLPVGLFAVLRGALTARYFGASWSVDAFTAAQTLALFLVNVAGSTLGAVSVPEVARANATLDRPRACSFTYTLHAIGALKFLALSLLIALSGPLYVATIGAHFDQATRQLCTELIHIFALLFFCSALSAQISASLNLMGSYAAPALSQILIPVVACASLLGFQADVGIKPLAWGVVIGSALQCLLLASALLSKLGLPHIRFSTVRESLARLARQYWLLALAAALMGAVPFVDLQMVAKLGPGSVALLAYGGLIPLLAGSFLASVVAGPALSLFSRQVASAEFTSAIEHVNRYIWLCLLLTALPVGLLLGVTPLLVDFLFVHRGAGVDASEIDQVQSLLLLHIPFFVAGMVAVRMLTALRRNQLIMAVASVNLLLKIVLNAALLPLLGVAGAALSTSLVYLFSLCSCWLLAVSALSHERARVLKG